MIKKLKTLVGLVSAVSLTISVQATPAYVGRTVLTVPDAHSAVTADFNQDGFTDVAVVSTADEQLLIYFGRGDGSFQYPPEAHATGPQPVHVAAADLNLSVDWYPDIVIVSRTASVGGGSYGGLEIFFNNGPGPLPKFPDGPPACGRLYLDHCNPTDGLNPSFVTIASLSDDVDSNNDLVASSPLGNSFQTFYSTAPPAFVSPCGFPR